MNMVKANPILGIGLNNFALVIEDYTNAQLSGVDDSLARIRSVN